MLSRLIRRIFGSLSGGRRRKTTRRHQSSEAQAAKGIARTVKKKL